MTGLAYRYEGARTLITGGMGFLGSNLALRLHALGAQVTLVDNLNPNHGGNVHNIAAIADQVRCVEADVGNPDIACSLVSGQDYIFNLVGQSSHTDSMQNPLGDIAANCVAPLAVLEACRHRNPSARIVYTSTRQVYGVPNSLPVDEDHSLNPVDINGCNNLAAEHYHRVFHKAYGLRTSIARLTNTYGPRMRIRDSRQNFLGFWIGEILSGRDITIFGDGEQLRDFNYVDDVVEWLLLCASTERATGEVFNLGGQEPQPLNRVARTLCQLAGNGATRYIPFPEERKAIDIGSYYGNAQKTMKLHGWQPMTSLEDGLNKTLAYFRQYASHYLPDRQAR